MHFTGLPVKNDPAVWSAMKTGCNSTFISIDDEANGCVQSSLKSSHCKVRLAACWTCLYDWFLEPFKLEIPRSWIGSQSEISGAIFQRQGLS